MEHLLQRKKQSGFTLIELLVVIAVIGLLSGIVLQSLQSARYKSQNAKRLTDIDQIEKAINLYMTKTNDKLPTSSGGTWNCIGLSSGTCWQAPNTYPAPTGTTASSNINLALAGNISQIPKDPTLALGTNGDYYMYFYRTSTTPDLTYFPNGAGAYIVWYAKGVGASCGHGYASGSLGDLQQCRVYLGTN